MRRATHLSFPSILVLLVSCSSTALTALYGQVTSSFVSMARVLEPQLQSLLASVFQPLFAAVGASGHAAHQLFHRQQEVALHAVVELAFYLSDQVECIAATPPPSAASAPRRGQRSNKTAGGVRAHKAQSQAVNKRCIQPLTHPLSLDERRHALIQLLSVVRCVVAVSSCFVPLSCRCCLRID